MNRAFWQAGVHHETEYLSRQVGAQENLILYDLSLVSSYLLKLGVFLKPCPPMRLKFMLPFHHHCIFPGINR